MSKADDARAWAEEWKPINGLMGMYSVSNTGIVMNVQSGKPLKPYSLPNGYQCVKFPAKFGKMNRYIHRFVADAFCTHPANCDVVNHIDNNPRNNRADNLEWTTQRDNVLYAMEQGRVKKRYSARPVIGVKDGEEYYFRSMNEAAQFAGCDSKTVWRGCAVGRVSQSGFLWKAVG